MKERGNKILRFLDRYPGIPLIFFLGLFKKRKRTFSTNNLSSIALLKTAGIGDTILLSGVIHDLQKRFPRAEIILFTGSSNYEAGKLIADITLSKLPMAHPLQALKIILKKRFDLWIDFDPWPRINAFFSFFAKANYKMGFKRKNQYRHFVYDFSIEHSNICHEINNYRKFLNLLGIKNYYNPRIAINANQPLPNKIALHLFPGGSRAYLKEWPLKKWLELIVRLLEKKYKIIFTGSKSDRAKIDNLLNQAAPHSRLNNLAGKLSLEETARELKTCACLISADTGIMHLGAALNIPVIALHGPTSPKRWGGIGKLVKSISPRLPCHPCIDLGFESKCKNNSCMQAIEIREIINLLSELTLSSIKTPRISF